MSESLTACCNLLCKQRLGCYRAELHDNNHPVSYHFDLSMREKQGFPCYWPLQKESA